MKKQKALIPLACLVIANPISVKLAVKSTSARNSEATVHRLSVSFEVSASIHRKAGQLLLNNLGGPK